MHFSKETKALGSLLWHWRPHPSLPHSIKLNKRFDRYGRLYSAKLSAAVLIINKSTESRLTLILGYTLRRFLLCSLLSHYIINGQLWVLFLNWNTVQIVPRRTKEPPEQHQRHTDQQPQYKKSKRYANLHHVKDGRAEAAQDAGEKEGPERHAGVEWELGQHKGVLSSTIAHIRVQSLSFGEKCCDPHG